MRLEDTNTFYCSLEENAWVELDPRSKNKQTNPLPRNSSWEDKNVHTTRRQMRP